jgi:hypothetical protein
MDRDLTGPDRHRSPLDPLRTRTGPPWPESADPTATPAPTSRALSRSATARPTATVSPATSTSPATP